MKALIPGSGLPASREKSRFEIVTRKRKRNWQSPGKWEVVVTCLGESPCVATSDDPLKAQYEALKHMFWHMKHTRYDALREYGLVDERHLEELELLMKPLEPEVGTAEWWKERINFNGRRAQRDPRA